MPQGKAIYFVTYPDGKVDQASLNAQSEGHAIAWFIQGWLPERWFGSEWANPHGIAVSAIWKSMREKGFQVHTIEWPRDQ